MLQLLKDIILNQHAYAHVMRDCFPLSDKTEWEKEQEQRTTKKNMFILYYLGECD